MINPSHYESEDGVFNLPLFLYDSLRDIMKAEFDQIRSAVPNEEEADRIVRLIKGRHQNLLSSLNMSLFTLGLVEPCTCKPKEICPKCHGAQWIMSKGIDYKKLAEHSDEILREAMTRRMQSEDHKRLVRKAEVEDASLDGSKTDEGVAEA